MLWYNFNNCTKYTKVTSMKFHQLGISFKYHGDEITRYWPWIKKSLKSTYHSALFSRDFNSFNEYWRLVGEETTLIKLTTSVGKMQGFSLSRVAAEWASRIWVNEYLVIMCDVDPGSKGPSFWFRLSPTQRTSLLEDVVVLRCKDETEMETLIDSISPSFSTAYGCLNGQVLCDNQINGLFE